MQSHMAGFACPCPTLQLVFSRGQQDCLNVQCIVQDVHVDENLLAPYSYCSRTCDCLQALDIGSIALCGVAILSKGLWFDFVHVMHGSTWLVWCTPCMQ